MRTMRSSFRVFVLLLGLGVPVLANEPVTVSVAKLKDVSLRIYGFLETDLITDSRQGFNESQANTLVPKETASGGGALNYAGRHYRTQMSVRQSRLGLDLTLPEVGGWKPEGILEIDFYGNNAPNTQPGTAPGTQTERDFFNNPAARIRHAVLFLSRAQWNFKVGQWWSLLGWQTEYFPPEATVQATVGQLNNRFPQARATYSRAVGSDCFAQAAADVSRPAQMNSGSPAYHGGLRFYSEGWKANETNGPAGGLKPLSAAVSGVLIPLASAGLTNPLGQAAAFDVFVPVIASRDGKSKGNTLSFIGEIAAGSGIGAVELPSLTLGVPGVTAAAAGSAIDQGVAGVNAAANIEPIRVRTFRGALNYTFPSPKWAAAAGYSQVEGRNLDRFSTTAAIANAIAPKLQYGFATLFYDPFDWLRLAAQASQTRDTYNDTANRYAYNNRLQLSLFFIF
ncbi:MAG: hypothetical protein HY077_07940 [Elusimicrobia bacterium]|nr:hypothetical protein [Elusimicrobiota bacterium]